MNKYILAGKLAEAGATETFIAEFFHHVAKDELRGDIFPEVLIADLCDVLSNAERNIKATRVVLESINGATEPLSLDTTIALFNAANDPNVSEVSRDSACFVLERGWWHAGLALVADAINHDREAILISGLVMLSRIKSSYDDAGLVKPECVDVVGRLSRAPVLALDDLGKERFTPWAAEQFMLLVDARYRAKLPLLVSSNFTPRELERHWAANGMDAAYGPALVRRIVSMTGTPVQVQPRKAAV